ncbi:MAG: hypothetical protein DRP82_02125, partial [Planctomycetota bacterium]
PATIQYTYSNPGWYTVKLTVSDGTDSNTCVKEMYIQVASNVHYVDGMNGDDGNGGTDWSDAWKTIGKALSVAADYDLVLVADATYNETGLGFSGKKIYLKGVDHNTAGQRPVIDCQQAGRAFSFTSGETGDSVVDSFTIQNGKVSTDYGGAIWCDSSSPTIKNCVFRSNDCANQSGRGGAVCCGNHSNPKIINCTFTGNSVSGAYGMGGAIGCYTSSNPTVTNCAFIGNSANDGGAISCEDSDPTITNCIFINNSAGNWGGAILCVGSSPTLTNCTFSGNSAAYGGAIAGYQGGVITLNNSILWGNSASADGSEIYVYQFPSCTVTLNHCCADKTGYGGRTGNIDDNNNCIFTNPLFVDPANGDYHLQNPSPCIDAGDNSLVPSGVGNDLDGNQRIADGNNDGTPVVDIGAYEKQ